jgi:hypothetical protein
MNLDVSIKSNIILFRNIKTLKLVKDYFSIYSSSKPRPKFGSAKGLIEMSDDFDEPLEDFKDYM